MSGSRSNYIVLTPLGRGAVATLSVASPNLVEKMDLVFKAQNKKPFSKNMNRDVIYGRWLSDDEDLVVSPINDQTIEIHCHGGNLAVAAIIESLQEIGFSEASEYEAPKLLGLSRWDFSLRQSLANSLSKRAAKLLLNQLLTSSRWIDRIQNEISNGNFSGAIAYLNEAITTWQFGKHLTKPWTVVLCGAPNAGKSSLINGIAGFQRAIVHATPGTTRDVISINTAIDGWPVIVKDTAGIRETTDEIESEGVRLAIEQANLADCTIWVQDATDSENHVLGQSIGADIVAINKSDLVSANEGDTKASFTTIGTSATTGQGIDLLLDAIAEVLVPAGSAPTQTIVVNEFQLTTLNTAIQLLQENKAAETARLLKSATQTD